MARCLRYDSHMKEIEKKRGATCLPLGMRRRRRRREQVTEEPTYTEVDENMATGEMPSRNPQKQNKATPQPLGVATSIKINPLFLPSMASHTGRKEEEGEEEVEEEEVFQSQLKKIRRTKEKEMIAAVVELAKYGDRTVGSRSGRKRSKLAEKVKRVALGRTGRVRKHKSPTAWPSRGRAFSLRPPTQRLTRQL